MKKHLPEDILELILSKLEKHVCPIYTHNDMQRDRQAMINVFKHPIKTFTNRNKEHYSNVSFEIAKNIYGLSRQDFERYSKYVKPGRNNKKNVRLDGEDLRLNILKTFNNCVEKWLSFMITKYSNICVPVWFCYLFLPLPETMEKHDYVLIAEMWDFFTQNNINFTESIIKFITDNSKNRDFKDLYMDCFGSSEEKKNKTISFFDKESILYTHMKYIDHSKFSSQTIMNARTVEKHAIGIEWLAEKSINTLLDVIFMNINNIQIEKLLHEVSVENLMRKAEHHDLTNVVTSYMSRSTKLWIIDDEMNSLIKFKEIVEHYNRESMTVLDDEPIWYSSVCQILDDISGFDTDDLKELIHDFPDKFDIDDSDDLREYFDRYSSLYNSLNDVGLTIRNDSKLCQTYVESGEYNGPTSGYNNIDQYSDLDLVVEMMKEMAFLYEKTEYNNIVLKMNRVGAFNSEKAKYISLYILHQNNDTNQISIPIRLRNLMKDSSKLKEAYDYWLDIVHWEELDRYDDSYSSEYDSDDS